MDGIVVPIPGLGPSASIVTFHGTDAEFETFDLEGMGGRCEDRHWNGALGVFVAATEGLAGRFGATTLEILVPLDRCLVVDIDDFRKATSHRGLPSEDPFGDMRRLRERILAGGHDFLMVRESCGGWGMGVSLDPTRIEIVRRSASPRA